MSLGPANSVSVVVPAFNAARFLPDALESVFQQTQPALEVIVVDDGSTDATPQVMERFRERALYLRKEKGGPASARNLGILRARGEWIAFVDADDLWLPERLERQLSLTQQSKADFVFSDAKVVDLREGTSSLNTSSWLTSIGKKVQIESELVDAVMTDPFRFLVETGFVILISTALIRKKSLQEVGLFDENIVACEDWDLFLRLALHSRMAFCPESLVVRRIYGGNLSLDQSAMELGATKLWEKVSQLQMIRRQPKWRKLVQAKLASQYLAAGVLSAENGDAAGARANLAKSLKLQFRTRAAIHWILLVLPASWGNRIRHSVRPLHRKVAEVRDGKIRRYR